LEHCASSAREVELGEWDAAGAVEKVSHQELWQKPFKGEWKCRIERIQSVSPELEFRMQRGSGIRPEGVCSTRGKWAQLIVGVIVGDVFGAAELFS
jgi:hypothetical protein